MRDVPVLPGEYSNWKDTGCELYPLCLEEQPRGKQQTRLKLRAYAIRKMRLSGVGVRTVAMAFGVSVRTVQREMKRRKGMLKQIKSRAQ